MSTSTHGLSILERLWEQLDLHVAALMDAKENPSAIAGEEAALKGGCLGIAKCIAIMTNPYDPDVDEVRRKAMERYASS